MTPCGTECPLGQLESAVLTVFPPNSVHPILLAGGVVWGAEKTVVSTTHQGLKHLWVINTFQQKFRTWPHTSYCDCQLTLPQPKPAQHGEQWHPPCAATQLLWAHTAHLKSSAGHFPGSRSFLCLHCACMRGSKDFHYCYTDSGASQCLEKKVFPHSWW